MTAPQPLNQSAASATHAAGQAASRVRGQTSVVSGKLGETAAAVFALAVAGSLWYIGALFTLLALETLGMLIAKLGAWRWLIPAGISAIELRWWPRSLSDVKALSFAAISGLDMLSTFYGLVVWSAGRFLPLGTGYVIPHSGGGLIVPALLCSIALTFVPERIALWALRELGAIWRA
jgi:hypothetical protein